MSFKQHEMAINYRYYKLSLFNAHTMILIFHIFMNVNKLCLNQTNISKFLLQLFPPVFPSPSVMYLRMVPPTLFPQKHAHIVVMLTLNACITIYLHSTQEQKSCDWALEKINSYGVYNFPLTFSKGEVSAGVVAASTVNITVRLLSIQECWSSSCSYG